MKTLLQIVQSFFYLIQFILTSIFGRISWQVPAWLMPIKNLLAGARSVILKHKKTTAIATALLFLFTFGTYQGYLYYESLPKPLLIDAKITEPSPSYVSNDKWIIDSLSIEFDTSVAPLTAVGKTIHSGFVIKPEIAGIATWETDSKIVFKPKNDWSIGQTYQIFLEKNVIAEHLKLKSYTYEFKTKPLSVSVDEFSLYQDPIDPKIKKIIARLSFSHPVDPDSVNKHISILEGKNPPQLLKLSKTIGFNISFDKYKLTAGLTSDNIDIQENARDVSIYVAKGIQPLGGSSALSLGQSSNQEERIHTIKIPSLYDYFKIASSEIGIVDDEQYKPQHVLNIETTNYVSAQALIQALRVYELPIYHPKDKEKKHTHHWKSKEVDEFVLTESKPVPFFLLPQEKEDAEQFLFKLKATPNRQLYIKINKGLKSFGDFVLAAHYDQVIKAQEFPKTIKFMYEGSLLSLSGDKKISMVARDLNAVRMELYRIFPEQIQHLLSQTYGDFKSPEFKSEYNFNEQNMSQIMSEIVPLDFKEPGSPEYFGFDLSKYIDNSKNVQQGVFLIKAKEFDNDNQTVGQAFDRRLIVVTDLGFVVKKSLSGAYDVFVQSIASGLPVAGANVKLIGKNGMAIQTAQTDAQGHAFIKSMPPTESQAQQDEEGEQEADPYSYEDPNEDPAKKKIPIGFVVTHNKDLSFMPIKDDRNIYFSRFDVGGIFESSKPASHFNAYLFSDRGFYRPSEEIHMGIIIKSKDWSKQINKGTLFELHVTDPRGVLVKKEKIRTLTGFEEFTYKTSDNSATGQYSFELFLVKKEDDLALVGSTSVRVQEFITDKLEISAHFSEQSTEGWVSPEQLKAFISLKNLFGGAADNRRIVSSTLIQPVILKFNAFPGYVFYRAEGKHEGFTEQLPEVKTNDKGEAEIDLNLGRFKDSSYRLIFDAEGFEAEGGRGVKTQIATIVSHLKTMIGYQPDGDLDYIQRDANRHVHLISTNNHMKKESIHGLKIVLLEEKYVSSLVKEGAIYRYQSVKQEKIINEKPFSISEQGYNYPIDTAHPGSFVVQIKNENGQILSRFTYRVVGEANISRSMEKNAELKLVLNKKDFQTGEEIEVLMQAPYTGAGFITIERDKVYAFVPFKSDTTNTIARIKVPQGLEGNAYVSAIFVRDLNSKEIFTSPLSYAAAPFFIDKQKRKIDIHLEHMNVIKPGQEVKVKYKTNKPAQIVLFAVDEGILQVARHRTPNPLDYFFQKRALQVNTSQILDLILPEFKHLQELSAPGGDADGALLQNLNPFKRKHDKPMVYWSGIIKSDEQVRDITFTPPETFNGKVRIMAIAVAEEAVGSTQSQAFVRADLVIQPLVPTFVAPLDEFDVSVNVGNQIENAKAETVVTLRVSTKEKIELLSTQEVQMKIAPQRESVAHFKFKAKDMLGNADFKFEATAATKQHSIMHTSTSIRPASPYQTRLQVGRLTDKSMDIDVKNSLYNEYQTLELGVSPLPLSLMNGLMKYLEEYPYGCTEQLTSRAMVPLILSTRKEFKKDKQQSQKILQTLIDTLRTRQNPEGSFGLWAANHHGDDFVSLYVIHFLIEAKARNQLTSPGILKEATDFLNSFVTEGPVNNVSDLRLKAYGIYLLARMEKIVTHQLMALEEKIQKNLKDDKSWKKDLAAAYMAATYQILQKTEQAEELIQGVESKRAIIRGRGEYYDSMGHTAQLMYLLSQHFSNRLEKQESDLFAALIQNIQDNSYNSISSAYTLLAMDVYSKKFIQQYPEFYKAQETLLGGQTRSLKSTQELFSCVPFSPQAQSLTVYKTSAAPIYYQTTIAGFDRQANTQPINKSIEIMREYTDTNQKPIEHVKIGEEIEVHIKIRSTHDAYLDSLAIVDLLPGGFEPVLESFKQFVSTQNSDCDKEGGCEEQAQPETKKPTDIPDFMLDYIDLREDRLILYGSANDKISEFTYRIKATNKGKFTVPPAFVESMYEKNIFSKTITRSITVE